MLDRKVKVRDVTNLGSSNYLLSLKSPEQARLVRPGQFVMLKCVEDVEGDPLLRRPFSIFAVRRHPHTGRPLGMEILVKDVGVGTHKLVQIQPGRELHTLGPQGRAFDLSEETNAPPRIACLVAGGVGIAALYLLARELISRRISTVLFYGARSAAELVLREYFERLDMQTHYCTEDGSMGTRGLVTDPLARFVKQHPRKDVRIYACGPWAMMRAAHILSMRCGVACEVSLEARMGCSLGACMGCVVGTGAKGTPARFIRVCMEGPVMNSRQIDWDTPPL